MRHLLILLFAMAHGIAAWAAAPKASTNPPAFAGERDQSTPVLLSASVQPVPFRGADGRVHIDYELLVTNTRAVPVKFMSLEILDADAGTVLGTVSGEEIARTFTTLAGTNSDTLEGSQAGFFWIDVVLNAGHALPRALSHRLVSATTEIKLTPAVQGTNEGVIAISQTGGTAVLSRQPARVLGPPLEGTGWIAFNGCCREAPHRRAGIALNGIHYVSQRFAIDWVKMDANGQQSYGDSSKNENWPTYGQNAIAVADGTVVSVLDGLPERVANALPSDTNVQNASGNHVILDLGQGHYGFYAHLQPGSMKVRVGDRVKRGQVLARLGNSGNTTAPHLHFHLSDGMGPLSAQGLPYVIDSYTVKGIGVSVNEQGKVTMQPLPHQGPQKASLPMDAYVVDFPVQARPK